MKVYLQYPWKFPDSPYYKYLIDNPPEGIEYLNVSKQKGVMTNKRLIWFSHFLKRIVRYLVDVFSPSMPNAHLSPKGDYDLIHCAHCLSQNRGKPWVADMEAFWQLWVVGCRDFKGKEKIGKIIARDNCKKILPWTEEVKADFQKHFPSISNKLEVVYPAIPMPEAKRNEHSGINLLFVGRFFFEKGGLHALEVMDRLTKKYKFVKGVVISEVPDNVKEKYAENERIKIYDLMSHEEVLKFYNLADIFVYPGYTDSFGFAFLEAMSFGIPIITLDGCSRKELIKDGKEGFIIPYTSKISPHLFARSINGRETEEIISNISSLASKLIEDKKLRKKMSKNCINEIKNGKFSIKERNKKLRKIYEDALK